MSPVGHFSPRREVSEGGVGLSLVSSAGSWFGRKTPTADGLRGAKLVWFDRETTKRELLACRRRRDLLCYGRKGVTPAEKHLTGRDRQRRLHRVRATLMQDKDEKLASENTMHSDIFSDKFVKRKAKNASNEISAFSKRVIQMEQTANILLTSSVIKILDTFYRDRCYARFYVLETIARVPYFAFMSVLHMYESFGWWRKADYLKVHFAESWNELHHLLIMEELGGNAVWYDRFLAQHIAIFYYFLTVLMYAVSPRMAYHFSECVERHAFETYDKFIKLHEEDLKKMPAPGIAVKYYTEGDLYLFDEFQTSRPPCTRRPKIDNLYDVFVNIRDDEAEHCKTMKMCQIHGTLKSPHSSMNDCDDNSECSLSQADCEGFVDCVRKSLAHQKK